MLHTLTFFLLTFLFLFYCWPIAADDGGLDQSIIGILKYVNHPEAKCMDGSRPAYYLSNGKGEGKDKWVIFLQGGGWCYDMERCSARAGTMYGSSLQYAPQMDLFKFFSVLCANTFTHHWNIVFVPYCDSSSFAGDSILEYNNQTIYFKGRANRDETINSFFQHNGTDNSMRTATEVVVTGCSAGGLAVFLGLDVIAHSIHANARKHNNHHVTVRGLADSGFFAEISSPVGVVSGLYEPVTAKTIQLHKGRRVMDYGASMRDVFAFTNMAAGANAACVRSQHNKGHVSGFPPSSNCAFAHHLALHIKTPLFLLHSQYDIWQLLHLLGSTNATLVNKFGSDSIHTIRASLMHESHPGHGAHIDSCAHHCSLCWGTQSSPEVKKGKVLNEKDAFSVWYKESLASAGDRHNRTQNIGVVQGVNWFVDNKPYPCQDCCICY